MGISQKKSCATEGCSKETKGRTFCSWCRTKQARERDPKRYAYNNLKSSSKKRGIFFGLTYEEFCEFTSECDYMSGKGRKIGSYNVDRIIEGKLPGYVKDNIQCLDKQKNIIKYYDAVSRKTVKMGPTPETPQEEGEW